MLVVSVSVIGVMLIWCSTLRPFVWSTDIMSAGERERFIMANDSVGNWVYRYRLAIELDELQSTGWR